MGDQEIDPFSQGTEERVEEVVEEGVEEGETEAIRTKVPTLSVTNEER